MGRTGRSVVTGEILIRRPAGEVFGVVADERNEPSYNPRMRRAEKLTPGPIGAGTRLKRLMEAGGPAGAAR